MALAPAEKFGHSTRSILTELGYPPARIASMLERKIAAIGWGSEYLPS